MKAWQQQCAQALVDNPPNPGLRIFLLSRIGEDGVYPQDLYEPGLPSWAVYAELQRLQQEGIVVLDSLDRHGNKALAAGYRIAA